MDALNGQKTMDPKEHVSFRNGRSREKKGMQEVNAYVQEKKKGGGGWGGGRGVGEGGGSGERGGHQGSTEISLNMCLIL